MRVICLLREPFVVRRRRVGGVGGAAIVASNAGPRPCGDAERHLPRVVQAAAPARGEPRRLASLIRLASVTCLAAFPGLAVHAPHSTLRRHFQVGTSTIPLTSSGIMPMLTHVPSHKCRAVTFICLHSLSF